MPLSRISMTMGFHFSFLSLPSLCYLWLVQINFTLLNCSREDLCCHSFGLDPLCKQLTCATVKSPNEPARMDRRDRPRGGAVRIHQNLWTPSVTWRQQRGCGFRDAQRTGGPTPPAALTSNTCADALDKLSSSLSAAPSVHEVRNLCLISFYMQYILHIAIISSSVPLCFWCQSSFPIWLHSIITSIEGAVTLSWESSTPPVGHWDVRLLPASFAGLWGIMHYYSWLVLAGIKAQGLLYFYTLPPP